MIEQNREENRPAQDRNSKSGSTPSTTPADKQQKDRDTSKQGQR